MLTIALVLCDLLTALHSEGPSAEKYSHSFEAEREGSCCVERQGRAHRCKRPSSTRERTGQKNVTSLGYFF